MGGVINRGDPLVVIRRRNRSGLLAYAPRDPQKFIEELNNRVRMAPDLKFKG
jgi:hypothetical protein